MGPFVILLLFLGYSAAQTCPRTLTCAPNASPVAAYGTCVCNEGYQGDGTNEGSGCSNIDECALGLDTCVDCCSGGVCVDTPGTFDCTCMPGYKGDGKMGLDGCTDINECKQANNCAENAYCVNFLGSYDCRCYPGYRGDGFKDGTGCTDIDECAYPVLIECVDVATCVNYDGGYRCECPAGYEGDGFDPPEGTGCTDIDECKTARNLCPPNCCGGKCTNTEGSYTCSCQSGYLAEGSSCTENKCKENLLINKQTWNDGAKCPWRIDMTSVDDQANPMINGLKHNQPNLDLYTSFEVPDPKPVFIFSFVNDGDYFLHFLQIYLTNNRGIDVNVTAVAFYELEEVQRDVKVLPVDSKDVEWTVTYQQNVDEVFYVFSASCDRSLCFTIADFNGEYDGCDTDKSRPVHINPSQGSQLIGL